MLLHSAGGGVVLLHSAGSLIEIEKTVHLEQGGVVTQYWFSYCDYSKPSSWNEGALLDSASSLVEQAK